MRRLLPALTLLLVATLGSAADPAPVKGTLVLRHVSADEWRADYRFDEAVDDLELGPAVVEFRRKAWTIRTKGAVLAANGGDESIHGDRPFDALRIDVRQYDEWAHDAYVPMDRHSDGGTAIYLGHFMGRVRQRGVERNLRLHIALQGLRGETTFLPEEANRDLGVYAYFGPQPVVESGSLRAIVDPATPAWIRASLSDTAAKVAAVYEAKLGRPAPKTLALIVGARALDRPGYSIKGGALPGQVVYKLEGSDLRKDDAAGRRRLQQLAAHELAHVWQGLVSRGGIGDTQPWVHEGGAEALSLLALRESGLWTGAQVEEYAGGLRHECRESEKKRSTDASVAPAWRDAYTCGYVRHEKSGVDAFTAWKRLMARTEASGEPYSEAMFDDVVK